MALAAASLLPTVALADEVTFVTDGGPYVEAQKQAHLQPVQKPLGID